MGNPKRRSHRRTRRSSRRRSSRGLSVFRNPIGGSIAAVSAPVKEMVSKQFLLEASSVAADFVLPALVTSKLVPFGWRDSPLKGYAVKVGVIAALAGASSLVSKRVSKAILLGGGVSLVLDIYTDFISPAIGGVLGGGSAGALPAPASGAATFFGDRRLETYWGDAVPGLAADGASIGAAFGGAGDAYA